MKPKFDSFNVVHTILSLRRSCRLTFYLFSERAMVYTNLAFMTCKLLK